MCKASGMSIVGKFGKIFTAALFSWAVCLQAGPLFAAIADCTGTSCIISIYDSASPRDFATRSVSLSIPTDGTGQPVAFSGNQAQITVGSITQTITCDGSTQIFGPAPYPDLQGTISCTMTVLKTGVNANITLYDLNTYSNYYSTAPSIGIDPALDGTSSSSPASVSDTTGTASRWQVQNVNDPTLTVRGVPIANWIVFARTQVSVAMSYNVASPPPYENTQVVCMGDVNGNGLIDEGENKQCITTPQGQLCPVNAGICSSSHQVPACPPGGTFIGGQCVAPGGSCSGGGTYNPVTKQCEINGCVGDSLHTPIYNTSTGKCEVHICPPGMTDYSWDPSYGAFCQANNVTYQCYETWVTNDACPTGSTTVGYNFCIWDCPPLPEYRCSWTNKCPAGYAPFNLNIACPMTIPCWQMVTGCPSGYALDGPTGKCSASPSACPSGYTPSGGLCVASVCPAGYSPSGSQCLATPLCGVGYTLSGADCVSNTPDVCPTTPGNPCMLYAGEWMCNAYPCQEYGSTAVTENDTPEGGNDLVTSTTNDDGSCNGSMYVFNGQDKRCRERSMYTGFTSCCYTASSEDDCNKDIWLGFSNCKADENDLACKKKKGLCVELDDYCSKTISILGHDICVQKKTSYCCFGSKLGRIIQEQGRRQLKAFNHTGALMPQPADDSVRHSQNMQLFTLNGDLNPQHPYCRGLTIDEFSALNWDLIDLKEYTDSVAADVKDKADQKIKEKMNQLEASPPSISTPVIP